NVSDVDFNPVFINITAFPSFGQLWTGYTSVIDTSASGFNTWTANPGTMLSPTNSFFYPSAVTSTVNISSRFQQFALLFDDFSMGAAAVSPTCLIAGSTVPCG